MILSTGYKVVIDTNVIISGIFWGGNPKKILQLFRNKQIEVLISPEMLFEIIRILEEFEADEKLINDVKYIFQTRAVKVLPKKKFHIVRDPKDNIFLDASFEGKADFLISGDKDFLTLKNFYKTRIISPKDFIDMIKE